MTLPIHSVLKLRNPPDDPDYPYSTVEIVGFHDNGPDSGGIELVLASIDHHAPAFCVAESMLNRANYELDEEASRALAARRAAAEAEVLRQRAESIPKLPWEVVA